MGNKREIRGFMKDFKWWRNFYESEIKWFKNFLSKNDSGAERLVTESFLRCVYCLEWILFEEYALFEKDDPSRLFKNVLEYSWLNGKAAKLIRNPEKHNSVKFLINDHASFINADIISSNTP